MKMENLFKMISTYEEYVTMPQATTIEKMISIHRQIAEEIDSVPGTIDLYEELLEASVDYATIRAKWSTMSREEKMEKDPLRTSLHNDVILHINILARYLQKNGKSALWRDELGDEKADLMFRKVIGDFACFLVLINGLCAR